MTSADATKKPILFLVDDESGMRNIGSIVLSAAGYDVKTFANGRLALDALQAMHAAGEGPAAMVTDGNMPVMDGGTLVREARALYPELPIVLGSGKAYEFKATAAETNTELLDKPYKMEQLIAAIAKAKERVSGDAPGGDKAAEEPVAAPSTSMAAGVVPLAAGHAERRDPQGHHRPVVGGPPSVA